MKVKKPSADCMLVFPVLPYTVYLACSRLSVNGEDTKVKGMQKGGGGGSGKKEKGRERACNHFLYDPLPPTFGTFEIIRFRMSNI